MADRLEEHSINHQDDSRTRNPTPEHQEAVLHGRVASVIHNNENGPVITKTRHSENPKDKSAQIIQELCHRVQKLEGRVATKEKHNAENGSHATSRSRSRHGRSPERRHDKRHDSSASRDLRHDRLPERRHDKRHDRSASRVSRDLVHTDDDRRYRETKCTRSDHVIMGVTPFTKRILKAKLPKGFDKPTDMKYDGTKDPQEHLTAFEARINLEGATDVVQCRAFPVTPSRTSNQMVQWPPQWVHSRFPRHITEVHGPIRH
ncbi:hypothetical protein Ahy_B10g105477 isoform B [Arachis hypogaea]|uniref:Uncharacterized protein n=1 Tax=Arachis hypogaea TaxID=3818 RepID=A0A444X8I1_ARAHY|nr:hypothetical protein Ahy_B10g105477 isoform B [Arachis hypogaea]